jgi:hypothetical protein
MCRVLVGKHEGRRPCGRPWHRYEGISNMNHKEIRWEIMNWIYVVQYRGMWLPLLNMITNFWVP